MNHPSRLSSIFGLVASLGLTQIVAGETKFDLAADFSASANPNGVWALGWFPVGSKEFNVYTHTNSPLGLNEWRIPGPEGGNGMVAPNVIFNPTTNLIQFETTVWQPRRVTLQPGPNGEHSVVRWTSPFTGVIQSLASFEGRDLAVEVTTDLVIDHNGNEFVGLVIMGVGPASYVAVGFPLFVHAGDTIDFILGNGTNANNVSDTTQVDVVVRRLELAPCEGPEPGGSWKSHGQYLAAVSKAAKVFVDIGLINKAQAQELLLLAARSDCGKN
jgi:hypothetical protein